MSPYVDVVVLGAGGMLGTHVVHALAEASLGRVVPQHGTRFFGPHEVRGYLDEVGPGVVINCIGYLGADGTEHFHTNGCLPRAVADWCERRALFIHVSTNAVFAPDPVRQWLPTDPIEPRTAYEMAKAFGEDPRAYVLRTTFLGRSGRGRNLLERLRVGAPYREANFNGVTVWELALRIVEIVKASGAGPRAGLEHVHSPWPVRISELAALVGSASSCEGQADNARLLGGGHARPPLAVQLAAYQAVEERVAQRQPG